ncbi:hypothetical protein Tco_1330754 [Tanacetum coccineum]
MLAYNVQCKAKNQKRLNNELKRQKDLLQRELETFKDRVKTIESKTIQYSTYKETCDELERELRNDKDTIDRDESNQIIQHVPRTESTPGKANAMKYEAGDNLSNEENDFMLDISYREDLEELTASVMLMARLLPADENAETVASYDAKAVSQVHASSKVHEQVSHGKHKTIIQTTDDDQIDSNIIFDDPFVENNGGTSEHDSTAHDEYREIQMLAYNVQREAENQKSLNNELKKQKDLLQRDLETFKDRLEKKDFKEREDHYLDDILDLEEKLSSHDQIVYKMGQSIQTIHMLGKKPNKVYDPFLKAGLGYTNPVRLKKAIAAQPKMYDSDLIHNNKLGIHTTDSEETLEDAEESQNKMRHKMVQIDYEKLNALYETFVPQQELSFDQTYFSIPSTSDNGSIPSTSDNGSKSK